MNEPLVSCVIPCYNSQKYIRAAIDSVLAQTYPKIEIIVVDDGSSDGTLKILSQYGQSITVLEQKNAGTGAARNTGVASSSGTFLAWLDSDDEWHPQKVADQIVAFEKYPKADVVFTRCEPIDELGNPPLMQKSISMVDAEIRADILRMMVVESEVMPSSSLLRRDAFDLVGGYDINYRFSEDWHLDFRLAQHSTFAYIDSPLTRYRIHDESKTKDRWPHALGRIKLRHYIESSRDELVARDKTLEMVRALDRHRVKYADAYYRIGKLSLDRGDITSAQKAMRQARLLNPKVVKYYTRSLRAELTALFYRSSVASGTVSSEAEWCRK